MRYLSITYYVKETELIHSGEWSVGMKCAKYGSAVYIPYLSFIVYSVELAQMICMSNISKERNGCYRKQEGQI